MKNMKQGRGNIILAKAGPKKFDNFIFDLFVRRNDRRRFEGATKLFEKVLS